MPFNGPTVIFFRFKLELNMWAPVREMADIAEMADMAEMAEIIELNQVKVITNSVEIVSVDIVTKPSVPVAYPPLRIQLLVAYPASP